MSQHTYAHRLADILTKSGLTIKVPTLPKVAVVIEVDSEALKAMFYKQSYKNKDLFITSLTKEQFNHYDVICYFGQNHHYGVFYLEDQINAFIYTNCDFVTKCVYRLYGLFSDQVTSEGPEHNYVEDTEPEKCRTIYWRSSYQYNDLFNSEAIINNEPKPLKKLGYSSDSCNYFFGTPLTHEINQKTTKFTVIIPTFNNHKQLQRALFSLKLEAYFSDLEILIIDNGSTDNITQHVIREYSELYPNIYTYFSNDVENENSSSTLNHGIKAAKSNYIVFLNPEDAGTGSYSRLFDKISKQADYDFVYGYSQNVTHDIIPMNQHGKNNRIIEKPLLFLIHNKFKLYKLQSAMFRRDFLLKLDSKFFSNKPGDERYFIYETYFKAKKVLYLNEAVVIHYINHDPNLKPINTEFFEHSITVENEIKNLFSSTQLYNSYLKESHALFIENTYLSRYIELNDKNDSKVKNQLKQIFEIHDGIYDHLSHAGKFVYDKIYSNALKE